MTSTFCHKGLTFELHLYYYQYKEVYINALEKITHGMYPDHISFTVFFTPAILCQQFKQGCIIYIILFVPFYVP